MSFVYAKSNIMCSITHKNHISLAFISTNRGVSFVKEHHENKRIVINSNNKRMRFPLYYKNYFLTPGKK